MGVYLKLIMEYCANCGLPPLTVVVVNKKTGRPGSGLPTENVDAMRESVFGHDWRGVYQPTPQELKQT